MSNLVILAVYHFNRSGQRLLLEDLERKKEIWSDNYVIDMLTCLLFSTLVSKARRTPKGR